MKVNRWFTVVTVAALMALAFVLRLIYEDLDNAFLQSAMVTVRNMIHISLLLIWTVSLHRRLVNRNVRRLMLAAAFLLILWLVDKIVKWDFSGSETHPLVRYLWYGFYVGMLFVPTLGAFIVDYMGKPESYKHKKSLNYLLIPPFVMLALVFTNDMHQRVFIFYNGFINFNVEYSYDWAYFLVMCWYIVMGFYFAIMIFLKSRVPGRRSLKSMHILIMFAASLFWIGYSMRRYDCDLTVISCLIIVLLLESAIHSGLLLSNSRYQEVFDSTTVPMLIVDGDYRAHYASGGARPLPEHQLRATASGTVDMGDSLLKSAPISAGHVIWQDNVSWLNELRSRLVTSQRQLDETNSLLQAEVSLKESMAKADEQNRLYDRIASDVEAQLIKADALLSRIETEPGNTGEMLSRVCVLGSYIKRRGNLLLLGEESGSVDARELEYCIRESMDNLNMTGIYTSFMSRCEGDARLRHVIAAYDLYEELAERFLDSMTAMMVKLTCAGGVQLSVHLGCAGNADPRLMDGVSVRCGKLEYEVADEDMFISFRVYEEEG